MPKHVAAAADQSLTRDIARSDEIRQVLTHPLLKQLPELGRDRRNLTIALGQYWHPIHFFTEFLPLTIAVVVDLPLRAHVSKILYQELGCGDAASAHERLYLNAARQAGVLIDDVISAPPLATTAHLLEGYRTAGTVRAAAIGYLYATELIDWQMVKSLGEAIANASGGARAEWVTVHAREEPDHVAAAYAATSSLPREELEAAALSANDAWRRWVAFYDGIQDAIAATMPRRF
jgi:hypothetical protein